MPKATPTNTTPLPIPEPPHPRPFPLPMPPDDERAPSRRRTLLAGIVAALAFPAMAGAAGLPTVGEVKDHPDADLIRICTEYIVNLHAYNSAPDGDFFDFEDDPLWIAYITTHDAIDAARPQTLEGVIAKARAAKAVAALELGEDAVPSGSAATFAWQIVGDLLRLGGQA